MIFKSEHNNKYSMLMLTTQQESQEIQNGSLCILQSNIWSQPSASTIWTSNGLNPFSPAFQHKLRNYNLFCGNKKKKTKQNA